MRLLFVIQRYGEGIPAGAEAHCRAFATRLVARGHHVEVLTSCAADYATWANAYAPGTSDDEGVVLRRLATSRERDAVAFPALSDRVLLGTYSVPVHLQRRWLHLQGPAMPELPGWLRTNAARFDTVIFFTYLYEPSVLGVPAVSGKAPVVMHPTAHDEPPLYLPVFRSMIEQVDAFAFSTPEEEALVRRVFGVDTPSDRIGIGVDLADRADGARFRASSGLGDAPYLLCLGRMDASKGTHELAAFFAEYKRRRPGPLRLVLAGDPVQPPPAHPDVDVVGVVDEATKHSAIAGAAAVVSPSFFESFSMVITEAWAQERPVLVQGRSDVLRGQALRSGGGLAYAGYAEFEAAVTWLLDEPERFDALGRTGRAYTVATYSWDAVLGRYEALLEAAVGRGPRRTGTRG
jgi:glycosyltransferase involved in cell wall biosynthesis